MISTVLLSNTKHQRKKSRTQTQSLTVNGPKVAIEALGTDSIFPLFLLDLFKIQNADLFCRMLDYLGPHVHIHAHELQFVQSPVIHHTNQIWWPEIEF